ncbi:Zinc finger protein [Actinidia chinensis var. chinensis]|uniref:Zinc finger protein n=1 Tax=Actinidia chinensis var. chinensis TaxID=1590841 RepID=A0A2R6RUI1_ACTCC|nr:Zinc finger protein [Actinidia chinensis var. chinensis]
MEEDQEQKFVCKICSKSFSNGKSMGGHMRGHLGSISAKKHDEEEHNETGFEDGDDSGYVLRENPKKTWRVSDSKHGSERNQNCCKQCGKVFPSLRALSGHMRCHSIKERENVCKECGKGFGSMRALFGHMRHHSKRPRVQLDRENLGPIQRKRSKKASYKAGGNFSLSNSNASCSYVSDNDVELEEAAKCLIMLSRDERNVFESNSMLESSENDSVIVDKAKALHQSEGNSGYADETWMSEKLDSGVSGSWNSSCEKEESEFRDLGSGFLIKYEKKDEFEVSIDGFCKDSENEIVLLNAGTELDQATFDVQAPELGGKNSEFFEDLEKKREYQCRTCNKMFDSYQALGGHQTSHRTNSAEASAKLEWHENLADQNTSYESKKSKDHECPICLKVFPSGQALGGHKRAHYIGLTENTNKECVLTKQELPDKHIDCDLNVPISLEKDVGVGVDVGFKPWWVGSDRGRKPLVISN